jgi:hypothetical protein
MQCPVCASHAKNLTPNTMDGVVVGCDHCGDYQIAGGAFNDLLALTPEQRFAALTAAKREPQHGGWPTINKSCISFDSSVN